MKKTVLSSLFIIFSAVAIYFSANFGFIKQHILISADVVAVFAVITFLVCLRFNKSRVSFMLALLLLWFFKDTTPYLESIPKNEFFAFISFNVLYLSNSNERGFFSVHGIKKAVFIISQIVLLYYFTAHTESIYYSSTNSFVTTVKFMMNMQFFFLPFIFLFLATVNNITRDKSYDISFATGTVIGITALFVSGSDLTGLNMLIVFVLVFIGVLSSIYTISYIDELTGLPGRRAYNEYVAAIGKKYTIAMSDIDHFKKFNDTHGHDTGDEVLKLVAKVLASIGGGGKVFRFGGEEFVIVFSGKLKEQTAEHLENIRIKIAETPFTVRNRSTRKKYKKTGQKSKPASSKNIKITMSFGASDSRIDRKPEKVMKEADKALYRSKKAGRNKVTV
jgi:diguanylate cyclase (GGDEF)-like protein